MPPMPTRRSEFWAGVRAITPLVIGAIPFGIIFGAVAGAGGLSPGATSAMSAFVFAGSAQFVAAGMVAVGAAPLAVIATTFIVNLRHVLYSVTLAPHMRHLPQRWLLPLGFLLTDETFVVVLRRYGERDGSAFKHWFYLGTATLMYANWQLCTLVGLWAGQALTNLGAWGMDFAIPLIFIGMLVPQLVDRSLFVCAAAAAVTALLLRSLPNQMGLIIAAVVGISAGVIVDRMAPALSHLSTAGERR